MMPPGKFITGITQIRRDLYGSSSLASCCLLGCLFCWSSPQSILFWLWVMRCLQTQYSTKSESRPSQQGEYLMLLAFFCVCVCALYDCTNIFLAAEMSFNAFCTLSVFWLQWNCQFPVPYVLRHYGDISHLFLSYYMQLLWYGVALCIFRFMLVYLLWLCHSSKQFANALYLRWKAHSFTYLIFLHKYTRVFCFCDNSYSDFWQILLIFSAFLCDGLSVCHVVDLSINPQWGRAKEIFLPLSILKEQNQIASDLSLPPPLLRSWKTAVPGSHILISTQICASTIDNYKKSRVLQVNSSKVVMAPKPCPDYLKRNYPRTIIRSSVYTSPEHFSIAVEVTMCSLAVVSQ